MIDEFLPATVTVRTNYRLAFKSTRVAKGKEKLRTIGLGDPAYLQRGQNLPPSKYIREFKCEDRIAKC